MGTRPADAGAILFGKTRRRVLGLLLGHPDEAFYMREILRRTRGAPGAVQRELELLTRGNLLLRTVRGRQVYFQANRASPVFPELRGLVIKTFGIMELLRDALAPLTGKIECAFVFGSAAGGELGRTSDVDLLVIGEASFADVVDATRAAQHQIGRDINPVVYTVAEFRRKLGAGHHFLQAVLREPRLDVIGGSSELERLGAQRLVDRPHDQRDEIRELLAVVERDLADSSVAALSPEWRLSIAYNAALQASTAALAAAGYRAARDSHHFRVIESLALTIGADVKLVATFDAYRKKRNISGYERVGMVSDVDADGMRELARELRERVTAWLRAHHPSLLKEPKPRSKPKRR